MTIPILQGRAPYYKRMIRCPGHYLISPKADIYKTEPVPYANELSNQVEVRGRVIKLRKKRYVKDAFGRKVIDWKRVHELFRKNDGSVIWPQISAAEAIERVYDPEGALCRGCLSKPCREGQGMVVTTTIRRLRGLPEIR